MKQTTILVVEDNLDHQKLIRLALARGIPNVRVDTVISDEKAYSHLEERDPPSLIVVDLWLGGTSGFDLLAWLGERETFADVPTIMFTSSDDPKHAKQAYSLGARRCLIKSGDFDELGTVIREELGCWSEPEADSGSPGRLTRPRQNDARPMAERSTFHVRPIGDHWVVRREDTSVDALRYRSKEEAVSGAFQLAEAFEPSVVIVHHEHGPPTRSGVRMMPETSDETVTPMREWFDRRDGSYWMLWCDRRDRDVLVFAAGKGERCSIEVDSEDGLEDRSDAELQGLLDEARR